MACGAALACPRCVAQAPTLWRVLEWHHALAVAPTFDGNRLEPSIGWYGRPWLYQLIVAMPYVLGVATYALTIAGLASALRSRTPAERVLLAFVLPYFAVVGSAHATFPRYLLPLVPACAVFAASAAHHAMSRLPRLGVAVAFGAILYSAMLAATQVARLGWEQQNDLARAIAAGGGSDPVAFPDFGSYFRLTEALAAAGLAASPRPPGRWFDPPSSYFVLPHWYATAIRRDEENAPLRADLARLERGRSGYRPVARWSTPWYLQRRLDEWLDPALTADLWHGAIGFTVYARDGADVALASNSTRPCDAEH
jgi:hypothetical protein